MWQCVQYLNSVSVNKGMCFTGALRMDGPQSFSNLEKCSGQWYNYIFGALLQNPELIWGTKVVSAF